MPDPDFFRNFGLFVRHGFLEPEFCLQIREQMCAADSIRAPVYGKDPDGDVLDEGKRKALISIHLDKSMKTKVRDRLMVLKPTLEEHFGISVDDIEKPAYLKYAKTAFHTPHLDAQPGDSPEMVRRRISIVIFLNAASKEPAANCYGGGSLTFYGLLEGPEWEKYGFALDAEPGLLIAFRPDTLHEVQPVTFGERFTIVTWFRS